MVMVGYQDLVRTHRTWNGLIMGGCHSVDIKMREMTNDVDESVTAHNGGNDHDQCHHHHDTHPGRKWWTCSNIVTQCWEMSSNISSLFYVDWCQPYSGKIFLITLSQYIMGWQWHAQSAWWKYVWRYKSGDTGRHRETQGGTSSPPRAGPHTATSPALLASVNTIISILLTRSGRAWPGESHQKQPQRFRTPFLTGTITYEL